MDRRAEAPLAAGAAGPEDERLSSLEVELRPAWADVDLDALAANLARLTERVDHRPVCAVVKADAYGHGAPRVARRLEREGVAMLAVALLEEGAELRRAGVEAPILMLGPARPGQPPYLSRYRITPAVSSLEQIELWRAWARERSASEPPLPVHLKVDTGMTRLGVSMDELPEALGRLRAEPGLELTGLLSHLAEAEVPGHPANARQEERFERVVAALEPGERERLTLHLGNTAGSIHRASCRWDMVRLGLGLYGYDPAGSYRDLDPVLTVRTAVVSLRDVPVGARLGYGGRWQSRRPSRIAVVPVGYADGLPWRLSSAHAGDEHRAPAAGEGAQALVAGRRVWVAGAVSMDMTMLDVTGVAHSGGPDGTDGRPVELGDEVVLLGRQGERSISAAEIAGISGTIVHEVVTRFGQRLPHRYREGGRVVAVESRLLSESF